MALFGMEGLMREAAESRNALQLDQLNERSMATSIRLWHLLVAWCDGKAQGVIKLSRKNGLEAWRQLKIE